MIHADEKLFRIACGTLMIVTLIAVIGVIFAVLQLSADEKISPETGFVTPAPEMLSQILQQPALSIIPTGAVPLQQSPLTITGNAGRGGVITYEVQENENLHDVAARFHLNFCTLVWSNPPEILSTFRAGTSLMIPPVDGLLIAVKEPVTIETLAKQSQVGAAQIIFNEFNPFLLNAKPDTLLESGQQIMIPGGKRTDCIPWQRPFWIKNNDGHPMLIGCDYSNEFKGYPTNAPLNTDFRFVRGIEPGHEGVDLAAPPGTPVYAAGDGMVRYAGWHPDGLGNVIVIDHGGSHSVYGHLMTITVTCGQPVKARQLIGGVGNTGNSNAPHLHFEVRDGSFTPENPMIFVNKGF